MCVSDVVSSDNIKGNIFPHSITSHQAKDEYIYQALNAISYSDETCSSLCYMHIPSTPKCHFFIQYGGTCMLGNFNISGTYSAPVSSFTAFFNESEKDQLYPFLVHLKINANFFRVLAQLVTCHIQLWLYQEHPSMVAEQHILSRIHLIIGPLCIHLWNQLHQQLLMWCICVWWIDLSYWQQRQAKSHSQCSCWHEHFVLWSR